MTNALVTCGNHAGVYFLEKWLPNVAFIYGDTSFIAQISAAQQVLLPQVSEANYIHQLLNICLDQHIESVFAMAFAEQALLAEAVELFTEFNIQLHLPDLLTQKLLFNLPELFQNLKNSGIKTVPFQVTSSFTAFSKACLALGYPTESIAVAAVQNPDLVFIVNDQLKTNFLDGKPVIPFTKAAKWFASDELLLLRAFHASTQKTIYASFTDGKLVSVWNDLENLSEEIMKQIASKLQLNGLFEVAFQQQGELFNIKPFFVK